MQFLIKFLEKYDHHFQKGGKLEKLHPLWDAQSTFLFTPREVTEVGPHVRDSIDLKRVMILVVLALIPCLLFSFYNTGYQTAHAYGEAEVLSSWQLVVNGMIINLPIIFTSYAVGGFWEGLFAIVRRHKISEGFLVTGILFPLTLPPTVPLWQVAVGISFGVVIGKEIFGGTGMNILNPALTARVFLFFSFPADISGTKVWTRLLDPETNFLDRLFQPLFFHNWSLNVVDSFSGATALLKAASAPVGSNPLLALSGDAHTSFHFWDLFIGLVPGSMGETSALMCLIGAAILIITGIGSWQIMVGTVLGAISMSALLTLTASSELPAFLSLPPHYQLVMGGFLFGAVYMATDPVSATATNAGKWIYGILIGILCILIRIWNPAYPEGMMLSILFMNIFAPLIDHFVVRANIRRRLKRATQ